MNSKRLWYKFRNVIIFTLLTNIVVIFSIVDIKSIYYYLIITVPLALFYLYINNKSTPIN